MKEKRYVFYYRSSDTIGHAFATVIGNVSERDFESMENDIRKKSPEAIITGFNLLEGK